MRREERAGDGDINGDDIGSSMVRGDDDVDFLPTGGRRAEALGGVDGGREEGLGTARNELAQGIVAAVAMAAGAAGELVEEMGRVLMEVVTVGNGFGRRVMWAICPALRTWISTTPRAPS